MGIRKRISAFLLAVLLSFGVCVVDYLQVDALEVGGSVVWDTAINYLLGLLGLSPITENGDKIVDFDSMRSKWVQDYEAYFYANVKSEDLPEGYTKERAYQNWIDNVCRGNLNTVEYGAWDIFKEWAETLPSENSGGGSGGSGGSGFNITVDLINSISGLNITSISYPSGIDENTVFTYGYYYLDSGRYYFGFANSDVRIEKGPITGSYAFIYFYPNSGGVLLNNGEDNSSGVTSNTRVLNLNKVSDRIRCFATSENKVYIYPYEGNFDDVSFFTAWDITNSGSGSVSSDYAVVNDRVSDLQIINDYSTTTTQNVVALDWDRIASMISDATGTITGSLDKTITDALDDSQEKVAAGTMSVANYNDYVTEISNTYVYDITNETSITNPDSTVTGVISGNVENAEFVLNGLQYVFPFCIPWDIKDFVTLLVADPVAPVIEYPIYNPVTDNEEIITIDFSLWENQVRIIRYIFDFLLIIGLLLLARSLIGAGGSD